MKRVLLDGVIATDATKVQFTLNKDDFVGSSKPVLRGVGFTSTDSAKLYNFVNGLWQDTGLVLSATIFSLELSSLGQYSIDITLAIAGPVSVVVETSGVV